MNKQIDEQDRNDKGKEKRKYDYEIAEKRISALLKAADVNNSIPTVAS